MRCCSGPQRNTHNDHRTKNNHAYARWPHLLDEVKKGRALAAARKASPRHGTGCSGGQESPSRQTQNLPLPHRFLCQTFSCQKLPNLFRSHSARCHDSVNLDRLACVPSIGMTLELWQETATCLFKLLHTSQRLLFLFLCCSIPRPDRSHHSPNPQVDTDRFS